MAEREPIPSFDLLNFIGLYTKGNNEVLKDTQLRTAINCDLFSEYGSLGKPPGSSRVLSSIYTESGSAKKISWLGFYKAADLNGQILRHPLIAAGTTLQRIESDGSLTSLATGRTEGLFATAARYIDLLFITNQDPDLIGRGDDLVKYDGKEITTWGIVAPGSQETVIESFGTASSFTEDGVTATNEATTTKDGAATSVTKTSTTQVNGDIHKLVTAFAVDDTITNRGEVQVFIPRGEIFNLADTAIEVFVGSDANFTNNYFTFTFNVGVLQQGWNFLTLDYSDATLKTGSPLVASLQNIRLRVNTKTAATVYTGIVWDRFVTFDQGTPVATENAAAGTALLSGSVYSYKVTFVDRYGDESNAGPASVAITLSEAKDQIDLTEIPVSTDDTVVARKIYRTVAGGTTHQFVDTIENNTDTTYADLIADLALGVTQPPLAGDVSDDRSPPPKAGIVKLWKRTMFLAGDPGSPENVYWSQSDQPQSWPTLNTVTLDSKITAIYETYSALIIETEKGKWQVTGDNPDFRFDKIINNIGCVGRRAAGETKVQGWAVDRDGMRLYDANNPMKISEPIRDKFDDDFNKANIELMHTDHIRNFNAISMFVADSSAEYKGNNYIYQYPLDSVDQGWWWELQLPTSINILDTKEIEDSNGDFKFYAGGDDGMVYQLFDSSAKNWATASSSEAITTQIVTKWFRPGVLGAESQLATGRVEPKFVELRVVGDPTTWTVLVETALSPEQPTVTASATITMGFLTNDNILRLSPPGGMQAGEYVRLTLTNSDADVSSKILGIRFGFHVHPGQFPIEPGFMNSQA